MYDTRQTMLISVSTTLHPILTPGVTSRLTLNTPPCVANHQIIGTQRLIPRQTMFSTAVTHIQPSCTPLLYLSGDLCHQSMLHAHHYGSLIDKSWLPRESPRPSPRSPIGKQWIHLQPHAKPFSPQV